MNSIKKCERCEQEKTLDELSSYNLRGVLYYRCYCKMCFFEIRKEYRIKNFEKISNKKKKYRIENKEEIVKKERKKYREKRIKIIEKQKIYASKNKDKIVKYQKKYREENKEKFNAYKIKWNKNKRLTDPKFRIDENMSSNITDGLKRKKLSKNNKSWKTMVDYSIEDLMSHLESKFKEGMSWDNYGTYWHIDHIRPKSWFSYETTEDEEFKKCWSLDNLQPLEASINISKRNLYEG